MVEVLILLMHLGVWRAWDRVAAHPSGDRLFYGLGLAVAFAGIYAVADYSRSEGSATSSRRGSR